MIDLQRKHGCTPQNVEICNHLAIPRSTAGRPFSPSLRHCRRHPCPSSSFFPRGDTTPVASASACPGSMHSTSIETLSNCVSKLSPSSLFSPFSLSFPFSPFPGGKSAKSSPLEWPSLSLSRMARFVKAPWHLKQNHLRFRHHACPEQPHIVTWSPHPMVSWRDSCHFSDQSWSQHDDKNHENPRVPHPNATPPKEIRP